MKQIWLQIKRVYRNASITQKFFVAYLIVLIIPTILILSILIQYVENSTKKNAFENAKVHVYQINEQINSRLASIENTANIILAEQDFLNFIKTDMLSDDKALIRFKQKEFKQMENIASSNPLIDRVSFYISNPQTYEIWPLIYNYQQHFPQQDYWGKVHDNGSSLWSLNSVMNYDEFTDTSSFYRLVELSGEKKDQPSLLEIRVEHANLLESMRSENIEFYSFIMANTTENNAPLILSEKSNVIEPIYQNLAKEIPTMHTEDQVQKLSPQERIENYDIFYIYNQRLNAYLVNAVHTQQLLRPIRSIFPLLILAGILMLLILLVVLRLLTKRIFSRMDRLHSSMEKVGRGEMNAKVRTGLQLGDQGDVIDSFADTYNSMLDEISSLMDQVVEKQMVSKDAQLQSLQNQIHSHFLYNALESIRMLAVEKEEEQIANALVTLGQLMRYSLRWRSDIVHLREELSHIRNYVHFINFMLEDRFELKMHVQEEVMHFEIPKMSLQPLVENVVQHASDGKRVITIQIDIFKEDKNLIISVQDNGSGIPHDRLVNIQEQLKNISSDKPINTASGLGLENVNRRFILQYGPEYGLEIESIEDQYTMVSLVLPWYESNLGGW